MLRARLPSPVEDSLPVPNSAPPATRASPSETTAGAPAASAGTRSGMTRVPLLSTRPMGPAVGTGRSPSACPRAAAAASSSAPPSCLTAALPASSLEAARRSPFAGPRSTAAEWEGALAPFSEMGAMAGAALLGAPPLLLGAALLLGLLPEEDERRAATSSSVLLRMRGVAPSAPQVLKKPTRSNAHGRAPASVLRQLSITAFTSAGTSSGTLHRACMAAADSPAVWAPALAALA